MLNALLQTAVATGDQRLDPAIYIAGGVAALVLIVLLCLPLFKKKNPNGPSDEDDDNN